MYVKKDIARSFLAKELILIGLIGLTFFLGFKATTLQAQEPVEDNYASNVDDDVAVSSASLVAHWKLDETTSGSYQDAVGSLDGSCVAGNCPTPTDEGRVNGAQNFEGMDTSRVNIPANALFDWGPNESFSIEVWVKGVSGSTCASSNIPGGNEVIIGRDDSTTELHWWIGCQANGGHAMWRLEDTNDDSDAVVLESSQSINDGLWHHIVAVRDGTNKSNRLYIDGIEAASKTNAVYSAGFSSAIAPLNVGWQNISPYYFFEGTIDELRIYQGALTPKEVLDNATAGPRITSTPNNIGYVGRAYKYQVEATGKVPMSYELVKPPSPNNMTINSSTGLLSWVPSAEGVYDVSLKASNSAGTDQQSFSITVVTREFVYVPVIIR
ncbi:MAG: putative Ig domain-containing protein [Anaerolineae bacterium]|nr:putative Ig domain-containing protein [Anaerolineae bacterium]